jgi:hypothetical protein
VIGVGQPPVLKIAVANLAPAIPGLAKIRRRGAWALAAADQHQGRINW